MHHFLRALVRALCPLLIAQKVWPVHSGKAYRKRLPYLPYVDMRCNTLERRLIELFLQFHTFGSYVAPFVGAVFADAIWGRYKTIMVFSLICL